MARPTVAEIDLSALRNNFRIISSLVPPTASVMAIVKADAYGHGAVAVARTLIGEGARMFGVATVEEGVELREAGIGHPVVAMGGIDEPQAEEAHAHGLSAALFDRRQIPVLARAAARNGKRFPVHVKIDTGMGRLGFPDGSVPDLIGEVLSAKELCLEGWMTHLSSADGAAEEDRKFTLRQLAAFSDRIPFVRAAFGVPFAVHALNSAGILAYRDYSFDMVRPGILLYGSLPAAGMGAGLGFRPVMRVLSRIVSLKELPPGHPVSYGRRYARPEARMIAAVPIGYADGYRRAFSNTATMVVMGRQVPVAGTVCMDHTMIDVTGVPGVSLGTEVVALGAPGATADDLARLSGTIPYEILTQVGKRIPRRVVG